MKVNTLYTVYEFAIAMFSLIAFSYYILIGLAIGIIYFVWRSYNEGFLTNYSQKWKSDANSELSIIKLLADTTLTDEQWSKELSKLRKECDLDFD
tara:strand:- start:89 stop:373 length:285 start_codon:yes stop_codon:yes gene_type:complete